MKTIVFITLLAASFVSSTWVIPSNITDSWLALSNPFFSECICQTGVKPNIALRAIANSDLVNDACLKCFLRCLGKNLNFKDAVTGLINEALLASKIAGVTPAIASYCSDLNKDIPDLCEKAYKVVVCLTLSVANATMV